MLLTEFEKLKEITERKLKFTEDNISSKLLDHPYFYHQYLTVYINEKSILDGLERKMKMVFSERYDFYKFKNNFHLDSIKEIEYYVNGDPLYDEACLKYNQQLQVVNYLVELLDMIKKMSFTMGNYIRMKEFINGK